MTEILGNRPAGGRLQLFELQFQLVEQPAGAKLDRFDLIILDDIGYAQKDQAETSVLFELIAPWWRI